MFQIHRQRVLRAVRLGALSLLAAVAAACSDNDAITGAAPAATPATFEGVAAVGSPLVGATVEFICTAGSPAAVTTGSDGAYRTTATGVTTPCVLVVTGGNVDSAAGAANADTLVSAVAGTGTANVTSLTTLQAAVLSGQDTALWIAALRNAPAGLADISGTSLGAALTNLKTLLASLPTPVTLPDGFDPARTRFSAVTTDQFDQLLETLRGNLATTGATLKDVSVQAAAQKPLVEQTPTGLSLEKIGGFAHSGGLAAAEIPAYDPLSKRLFVVNGSQGTVDVLNLTDPAAPTQVGTITTASLGTGLGGANGVAVYNGVVALAIEASPKTGNGMVALLRATDLAVLGTATVGALPDMLTFTPDGRHLLVANEGEPNSYGQMDSVDPEGSVSVIELPALSPGMSSARMTVTSVGFAGFNSQSATLIASGVRIFGPGATVAQDLEPEYIAVSADSKKAYVTLQENNAIAVIDIASRTVESIKPLGLKDHSLSANALDVSNEDGGTNTNSGSSVVKISTYPIKGMYLPDAVAAFTIGTRTYLITANEGDAREWPGIPLADNREDPRARAWCNLGVDPTVFDGGTSTLVFDSNLGRLRVTAYPPGGGNGKNEAGQCTQLVAFGGRSFSIWDSSITQVYDSGSEFETRTAALATGSATFNFNASNDNNDLEDRSPAKGPEPEGVVIGKIGAKTYAFIGLERVGGVMVYDVSNPAAPVHVAYLNTRTGATGDRGPEGLAFIRAAQSPNGKPLLVVGNETSGTTAIFQINLSYGN